LSAEKIPASKNRRQKCSAEYAAGKKNSAGLRLMTDIMMASDILINRLNDNNNNNTICKAP